MAAVCRTRGRDKALAGSGPMRPREAAAVHRFRAMNSNFSTYGLSAADRKKAESWFAFVEANLSRFRPDSELSRLNRSGGRPFLLSPLLYEVLLQAEQFYRTTEGLFTPYLGKTMEELGYGGSFEELAEWGEGGAVGQGSLQERELEAADQAADHRGSGSAGQHRPATTRPGGVKAPLLNAGMRSVVLGGETAVDLGGIAKGLSAARLARMLRAQGVSAGGLDAGGDLALWGGADRVWEVGVEDPFRPGTDRFTLHPAGDCGIATSSAWKRRWKSAAGRSLHHILDPRTGQPAGSDLVQVTVAAPDLTQAEVYAKCVLILGSEQGMAWLERRGAALSTVGIRRDGAIVQGGRSIRITEGGREHG
ncbi:FAD:protein FMN transferase [Paenibacillus gansuensis]|uniref:FAD:protein FMN transferase n=1 Tax=Paenibacillus gansuensis TaxID=306542 RepID=A0ABW5PG80_9BACL